MKHLFWTFWLQKTFMKILGWVVGWGATWGGGKGAKMGKIEVLMEVVNKNDEI